MTAPCHGPCGLAHARGRARSCDWRSCCCNCVGGHHRRDVRGYDSGCDGEGGYADHHVVGYVGHHNQLVAGYVGHHNHHVVGYVGHHNHHVVGCVDHHNHHVVGYVGHHIHLVAGCVGHPWEGCVDHHSHHEVATCRDHGIHHVVATCRDHGSHAVGCVDVVASVQPWEVSGDWNSGQKDKTAVKHGALQRLGRSEHNPTYRMPSPRPGEGLRLRPADLDREADREARRARFFTSTKFTRSLLQSTWPCTHARQAPK